MHCCTGFLYLRIFHSLFSSFFFKDAPNFREKRRGFKESRKRCRCGDLPSPPAQDRTQFQSVVRFHLSIWLLCRCLLGGSGDIRFIFLPFQQTFLLFFSPGQWCKCSTDSHYIHSRRCAILFGVLCPCRCVCVCAQRREFAC